MDNQPAVVYNSVEEAQAAARQANQRIADALGKVAKYNPDQPRAADGRFGEGDGQTTQRDYTKMPSEKFQKENSFHWSQPKGWSPDSGQSADKAMMPLDPSKSLTNGQTPLQAAVSDWKTSPSTLKDWTPEMVSGVGNPPWVSRIEEENRVKQAALMNELADNATSTEKTLWRGFTDGRIASFEEAVSKYSVGAKVDLLMAGFSENKNTSTRFAVGDKTTGRGPGIPIMYSVEKGAQSLKLDDNLNTSKYVNEKEHIIGGRLEVTGVQRMSTKTRGDFIQVNVRQVATNEKPPGGWR